jgi:hypothetical protein
MNTTPLQVPLFVAGLGLIGTAFGALGGAWLTQRRADMREELDWNRDLEREQARGACEGTARTFEYRRKACVNFYQAAAAAGPGTARRHRRAAQADDGAEPRFERRLRQRHAGGRPGRATPPGRDPAGPRHRQGGPDQPGRLTVAEIHDRIKDVPGFDADTAVWAESRKNGSKGVVTRFSAGMERIRAHDRNVAITIARSWARAHRCQLAATANTLCAFAFAIVPHRPHRHVGRWARSSASRCSHNWRVIRWPAARASW